MWSKRISTAAEWIFLSFDTPYYTELPPYSPKTEIENWVNMCNRRGYFFHITCVLTVNILQRVHGDLRSRLICPPLLRRIQDPVHQVDLGVVEHTSPQFGQQGGCATTVGLGGAQVHKGDEERLQSIVQGLQEGESKSDALCGYSYYRGKYEMILDMCL